MRCAGVGRRFCQRAWAIDISERVVVEWYGEEEDCKAQFRSRPVSKKWQSRRVAGVVSSVKPAERFGKPRSQIQTQSLINTVKATIWLRSTYSICKDILCSRQGAKSFPQTMISLPSPKSSIVSASDAFAKAGRSTDLFADFAPVSHGASQGQDIAIWLRCSHHLVSTVTLMCLADTPLVRGFPILGTSLVRDAGTGLRDTSI